MGIKDWHPDIPNYDPDQIPENWKADPFVMSYLHTALWASHDENGRPLDVNYSIRDFSKDAILKALEDCWLFVDSNDEDLDATGATDEQLGHDFWLTRNGHGAGFWDRGYPREVADRLTVAAHAFGDTMLYVGDDGLLYFS